MILGSRTVGPFDFEPHVADRLKLYAFDKNCSIGEVIADAVKAFIDADVEAARHIDLQLARRYGGTIPPERKTKRDLRDESAVQVSCEDQWDPGYRAEHGLPPLDGESNSQEPPQGP